MHLDVLYHNASILVVNKPSGMLVHRGWGRAPVVLVEAVPRTGRLHQIRRHLKHIDHPLIGDSNYGRTGLNREMSARYGLGRLALHCRTVTLKMPGNPEPLQIGAPAPADLADPLKKIDILVESFF